MDVLVDANVLFSATLTDVLLSLAEDGLLLPLWTERILKEAEGAIVGRWADTTSSDVTSVHRRFIAMRAALPASMIDPEDYEALLPQMLNHEKDRHVLAAAVAANADLIITANVKHFPRRPLRAYRSAESLRRTSSSALCTATSLFWSTRRSTDC